MLHDNIPGADPGFPVGGASTLVGGGTNLRHRHFSVKTYVKMKEFGPVGGGGRVPETFVCRSATVYHHSMIVRACLETPKIYTRESALLIILAFDTNSKRIKISKQR